MRTKYGLSGWCLWVVFFFVGIQIPPYGWSQPYEFLRTINEPNPTTDARFGARFEVFSQDLIAITSFYGNVRGSDAGRVILYNPQTGEVIYDYPNPFPDSLDLFGSSAVLTPSGLLIIGAMNDDGGDGTPVITDSGSVYVYNAATHEYLYRLRSPHPVSEGRFAEGMVSYGNLILVTARGDTANGAVGGAVYLMDPATGEVIRTFTNPTPAEGDLFGYAIAISGSKCLISARYDDTAGIDSGAAYIFDIESGELLQTLLNPSPDRDEWSDPNDNFGIAVDFIPGKAIVTSRDEDNPVRNSGVVYIFDEQNGELLRTFYCPDPTVYGRFGGVSAHGEHILIAGTGVSFGGREFEGAAYLFNLTDGSLIQSFYNPHPSSYDFFGQDLYLSDDLIIIGSSYEETNLPTDAGVVYVYRHPNTPPTQPTVDVTPDDPMPDDDLFCSATGSTDPEGATVTYSYAWYSDGMLIESDGFNSTTGPSLSHLYTERNQVIECQVTPADDYQDGPMGSDSVLIRDLPPTAPLVDITPDNPYTLDDLICSATGSTDREGAVITYSYAWYRDGVLINTDGLHSVTGPSLSNVYTARDQVIECRVTPNDGYQNGPQASDSVVILNTPPPTPIFRLLPENPTPDDGLAVTLENPDPVDADGDLVVPLFMWSQSTDGSQWVTRTELSGRLTPVFIQGEPEISSLYTQIAEYWRVDVNYVDFKSETDFNTAVIKGDPSLLIHNDISRTNSKTTFILPDVDGDDQVGPSDLLVLESVWGKTKREVPSSLRPLFFESSDPANARISLREILGLGGLGWYRAGDK